MKITAPEYLILLAIGVLNIWAALILASVRARAEKEPPMLPAERPLIETGPRSAEISGI